MSKSYSARNARAFELLREIVAVEEAGVDHMQECPMCLMDRPCAQHHELAVQSIHALLSAKHFLDMQLASSSTAR